MKIIKALGRVVLILTGLLLLAAGIASMLIGIGLTLTIIGAILGIPMILAGWSLMFLAPFLFITGSLPEARARAAAHHRKGA